jgi:CheY-like chemotaxis protein
MAGARIVVVEDDENTVELYRRVLARMGHALVSADNGIDGLELCLRERPDLIITNIKMPRMDGWELCRRLRQHPEMQTTPILVVSGQHKPADVERHYAAGADQHLPKPFELDKLRTAISELLNLPEGRTQGATRD